MCYVRVDNVLYGFDSLLIADLWAMINGGKVVR